MQELYVPQERYMRRALELAEYAASLGEVPVGAVVVHKPTDRIIGEVGTCGSLGNLRWHTLKSWRLTRQAEHWAAGE